MNQIFYEIYQRLPRGGPGDVQSTRKAFQSLGQLPSQLNILDLGCGKGVQTLELAQLTDGEIIALDNYQPFLDELQQKAIEIGFENRINCVNQDLNFLELPEGYFDLIWAEGSIYIIGFEHGLKTLTKYLKSQGYLAVTEVTWLKNNPPQPLQAFWNNEYPAMKSITENLQIINSSGYKIIESFSLPAEAWWDNYYQPLEEMLRIFQTKCSKNSEANQVIQQLQAEIDIYKIYSNYYGYLFYIMQKLD